MASAAHQSGRKLVKNFPSFPNIGAARFRVAPGGGLREDGPVREAGGERDDDDGAGSSE
jgi:hypothetical protein